MTLASFSAKSDIVVVGASSGSLNNPMMGYSDMSFLWAVPTFDIQMLNLGDYSQYLAEPEIVVEGKPAAEPAPLNLTADPTVKNTSDWAQPDGGCEFAPICLASELEPGIVYDSEEDKADQKKVDDAVAILEQTTASLTSEQKEQLRPMLEQAANEAKIQETLINIGDEPDFSKFSEIMANVTVKALDISVQNGVIVPDAGSTVTGQILYDHYFHYGQ